jgi:spermidine/putrescine transport system substrate-binding protein
MKDGPGSEQKAHDLADSWLSDEAADALVNELGYGQTNPTAMAKLDPQVLEDAGLGPITVPILAQTPNSTALREKQLAEFEKIKAGF